MLSYCSNLIVVGHSTFHMAMAQQIIMLTLSLKAHLAIDESVVYKLKAIGKLLH